MGRRLKGEMEMRGERFRDKEKEMRVHRGQGEERQDFRLMRKTGRWTSADIAFPFLISLRSGGHCLVGFGNRKKTQNNKIKNGFLKDFGFVKQIRG